MVRKLMALCAAVLLIGSGLLVAGCESTSTSDNPSALRGSDQDAARTAYFQGHNKSYGYYGR